MKHLRDQISETIQAALPDAQVYVFGDDGEHFEALVVSATFEGMMLVKQHQLVMRALKDAFASSVHAMALKTFTPEKWEQQKSQFGF